MGSIRSQPGVSAAEANSGGSVRLLQCMFQFQTGSIRSDLCEERKGDILHLFRFQIGAIKFTEMLAVLADSNWC